MAHTVAVTTLLSGYKSILHVALISDGASGELADRVLITPADLGLTSSARLAVESVEYNFAGFDARLEFDSGVVDDNLIWVLSRNLSCHDFMPYGGLKDPSGLDGTGKIQLSTSGFGTAGAQGSLIIKLRNG